MVLTTKKNADPSSDCAVCDTSTDDPMIECSTCLQWIHFKCAGLSNTKVKKIGEDDWYCASCLNMEAKSVTPPAKPEEQPECVAKFSALLAESIADREEAMKSQRMYQLHMKQQLERFSRQLNEARDELSKHQAERSGGEKPEPPKYTGTIPKKPIELARGEPEWKRLFDEQMKRCNELKQREAEMLRDNEDVSQDEAPYTEPTPLDRSYEPKYTAYGFEKFSAILARPSLTKLKTFSGEILEWGCFKKNYEETSDLGEFNELENKRRLEEALEGQARALVRHHLMTSSKGSDIMKVLNERYGRPESLVIAYLQPWLDHPAIERTIDAKLYTFAVEGQQAVANIETIGDCELLNQEYVLIQLMKKLEKVSFYHQWMEKKEANRKLNLRDFANFLMEKAKRLPTSVLDAATIAAKPAKPTKGQTIFIHGQGSPAQTKRHSCYQCKEAHGLWRCSEFLQMPVNERWNLVKQKQICSGCLRVDNHTQLNCPDKRQCNIMNCERFHNKLLHFVRTQQVPVQNELQVEPPVQEFVPQVNPLNHHETGETTYFKVVPVQVLDQKGRSVETFALLDGGSSASLIDKTFLDQLGLSGKREKLLLQWTKGITREEMSTCTSIQIRARKGGKAHLLQNVFSVENLNLPNQDRDAAALRKRFRHLRGISFADFVNAKPTILIGLENAKLLVETKTHQGNDNEPVASKTPLGWIVWGRPNSTADVRPLFHQARVSALMLHDVIRSEDQELHNLVQGYFSVENFGVTPGSQALMGRKEKRAVELMTSQLRYVDGRAVMPLLWEHDDVSLPNSYPMALKRYKMLEKKLSKDPSLEEWMNGYVKGLLEKGYARKATEDDLNTKWARVWYAPLFIVVNQNKEIPKPRVVADVAAQVNGVSLNSKLLKGPDLMAPLLAGMFQFRVFEHAVNADVREMFPQIVIKEEDQQCQRFLHRDGDKNQEPSVFVMQRMMFGPVCSPATAQFVKNQHASQYRDRYPEAVKALTETTYVDDYFNSHKTVGEAFRVLTQAIEICASIGFELVGAQSNSLELVKKLPEKNVKRALIDLDPLAAESYQTKILGMHWKAVRDVFIFKVNTPEDYESFQVTKREVLRYIMKTWDPLGILAHFLIQGKMILQHIWRDGSDWDEEITPERRERWIEFVLRLADVEKLEIRRHYSPNMPLNSKVYLIAFVDASEEAYAAVAYLRFEAPEGRIHVTQVLAKSKVAPVKPLTIPKLELMAAVLGKRLVATIKELHPTLHIERTIMLGDSECVLHWIWSEHFKFTPFVAARISEILDATHPDEWFHVPTEFNVADDATRYRDVGVGDVESRWYQGPAFLRSPIDTWPISQAKKKVCEETRRATMLMTIIDTEECQPSPSPDIIERIKARFRSTWRSLVNVVAYILRAADKIRKRPSAHEKFTTVTEFAQAELVIFRKIQRECFQEETRCLQSTPDGSRLSRSSQIAKLNPFLDDNGVIRMRSRSQNAESSYAAKNPPILPTRHELVDLLIHHHHCNTQHMANETTIGAIREIAWVINIRSSLRRVKSECLQCRLGKVEPQCPPMGQLPFERLDFGSRPFTNVGLDCFGPLNVRQGRATVKRYGIIFTCLTFRAVHLELLADLSTDQVMMAIRALFARRGQSKIFFSDNGKNFVGASNQLARDFKDVEEILGREAAKGFNLQWKFIPAYAPWMGGAWERLIKSVKSSIDFTLKGETPREDVLRAVLIEAEYNMNQRPLTHTPIDHEDAKPLTPNTALFGDEGDRSAPQFLHANAISPLAYRRVQHLSEKYLRRWLTEYLPEITRSSKWHFNKRTLAIDDIVIMIEPQQSPGDWKRGRIVRVYPGPDGVVRSADVMLGDQSIKTNRAAGRLAVLDLKSSTDVSYGPENVAQPSQ